MNKLESYNISEETGFIINQKEIINISPYYTPWIELNKNLEEMMNSRTLCKHVEEMPLLSLEYLLNNDERRYCRCILAMASTAFVWYQHESYIPKILPKSLAIPLRKLSDYFGLMPILTHTDMVLINTIVDKTMKYDDKRCLRIKNQITNNNNWTVFQRETARIEFIFAPVISTVFDLYHSIENNQVERIISSLRTIHEVLQKMKVSMNTFKEMDPDYFHTVMRPFLVGWSGAAFSHDGGLYYEEEDGSYIQLECIGASAAQSPTLQLLDSLFKIEHSIDNQSFFDTMKNYMLKGHRDFIADVKTFVKLVEFVEKNNKNKLLVESYNNCLEAISSYRTGHMKTVTKYIINPAKRVMKSTNSSQFLQEKGTGGQDLIKFLKEVRDDVGKQLKNT